MRPLVIRSVMTFAQLADELTALGWVRGNARTVLAPIIPGEPELASFDHPSGARAIYTFNPVVYLRVIELHGPGADVRASELRALLPIVDAGAVARMLDDDDEETVLRGLLAVRWVGQGTALPSIERLTAHSSPLIANAARAVVRARG